MTGTLQEDHEGGWLFIPLPTLLFYVVIDLSICYMTSMVIAAVTEPAIGLQCLLGSSAGVLWMTLMLEVGHAWSHKPLWQTGLLWLPWVLVFRPEWHNRHHEPETPRGYWAVYRCAAVVDLLSSATAKELIQLQAQLEPDRLKRWCLQQAAVITT